MSRIGSCLDRWARTRGRFTDDACRWIQPGEVTPVDQLSFRLLLRLLRVHLPLRAMAWYRLAALLFARRVPALPTMLQHHLLHRYGLELSPAAEVEGGLYIAHPVGCTIHAEHLGRDVTIIGPVTVGYRSTARWPRIEHGVYIGAGARVLGDVDVREGARIGANAVVVESVAAHTTVVGMPARPVGERAGHGSR